VRHLRKMFVLAVVLFSFTSVYGDDGPFTKHMASVKESVFRVENENEKFLGTAFTINKYGCFVTCAHVIKQGDKYRDTVYLANYISIGIDGKSDTVRVYRLKRFAATVVATILEYDLTILQVNLKYYGLENLPFFPIANSDKAYEGQEIAICAFIDDKFKLPKAFIAKGIISTIRSNVYDPRLDNSIGIFQMDLSISKGTSGGPIFYPESKRVVAIQNAGIFETQKSSQTNYAIAITLKQILSYLDSLKIPYDYRE